MLKSTLSVSWYLERDALLTLFVFTWNTLKYPLDPSKTYPANKAHFKFCFYHWAFPLPLNTNFNNILNHRRLCRFSWFWDPTLICTSLSKYSARLSKVCIPCRTVNSMRADTNPMPNTMLPTQDYIHSFVLSIILCMQFLQLAINTFEGAPKDFCPFSKDIVMNIHIVDSYCAALSREVKSWPLCEKVCVSAHFLNDMCQKCSVLSSC